MSSMAAQSQNDADLKGWSDEQLAGITAPVLVVAGAEDAITGCAPAVALARRCGNGRAEVLERCGHYPWVERPTAFRHTVATFLDGQTGPG